MLGLVTSPVHPSVLDCVGWVLATVLCTVLGRDREAPDESQRARQRAPGTEPVGVRMPQVAVAVHGRCDSFIRYTQKLPFRPRELWELLGAGAQLGGGHLRGPPPSSG